MSGPEAGRRGAAVVTVIAKNYLAFARTLMASVARWEPAYSRVVVIADRVDGYFDPRSEPFEVISSRELPIPETAWFHFKYSVLELNTAIKPFAIEHLLRLGFERVFYFDADVKLFGRLEDAEDARSDWKVLITPHLLEPIDDGCIPAEIDILRSGSYNLGFIGVSAGSRKFLEWWCSKVYDGAYVDIERGLFTDQKWIDMAPGLFPGVRISRDPGFNVAYWNLKQRAIAKCGDEFTANGVPLRFFHFSGFQVFRSENVSRHQNRVNLHDLGPAAEELVRGYGEDLIGNGLFETKWWPAWYRSFQNGMPIADIGRWLESECPGIRERIGDPFSAACFEEYMRFWNGRPDGAPNGITRLADFIYRRRLDLQRHMPDPYGRNHIDFLEWFLEYGQDEYDLHDTLLTPVASALLEHRLAEKRRRREALRTQLRDAIGGQLREMPEPIGALVAIHGDEFLRAAGTALLQPGSLAAWLNRPVNAADAASLTHLADLIYSSRPDLQERFREVAARRGSPRFLRWLLTYGAAEYQIAETWLAPWRAGRPHRIASILASIRTPVNQAKAPADWVARVEVETPKPVLDGINAIAYLGEATGVGEGGRSLIQAARAAGLAVRVAPFPPGERPEDLPYSVNICHVNADQTRFLFRTLDPRVFEGRYNVGYWAWELSEFPDRWLDAFGRYDEIWVPSTFCLEAVSRKSPIPVYRIPHAIAPEVPADALRAQFGLPEEPFLFLGIFDMRSVFRRKNPLAAVQAFQAAFGKDPARHLAVKAIGGGDFPEEMTILRRACAGYPNITILDATFSRRDTNALLLVSDCLVSLHRSEGFGLALAEAMYMGTPVICTGYSGNMDFTTAETSLLVNFAVTCVGPGARPYSPTAVWAEPDAAHAVETLRRAARDPDGLERIARKGQEFVRASFSPQRVGEMMRRRLGG